MAAHKRAFIVKTTTKQNRPFEFNTVASTPNQAEANFRKLNRHWKRPIEVAPLTPDNQRETTKATAPVRPKGRKKT